VGETAATRRSGRTRAEAVAGNTALLRQTVLNLLDNALAYPAGGLIVSVELPA
jgi:signal transduction histidine kinase